ncbi:MAG: hypothetical protein WCR54_07825, partial [Clostridia bacterium]
MIDCVLNPKKNNRQRIYKNLITLFANLSNQIFSWENLPKELPSYMIEYYLFSRGNCILCKYENTSNFFALSLAKAGKLDAYGRMINAYP